MNEEATNESRLPIGGPPSADAERDAKRAAPASPEREEASRRLCLEAARLLQADKCREIVVLDLRSRSPVTDFFVIASGTSDRQLHSSAEDVVELAEGMGISLYRSNLNEPRANWIVLDFVDALVHLFMPEARAYYDLEMLWGDAPRLDWEQGAPIEPTAATRNRAGLTQSDVLPLRPKNTPS